MHSHAYALPTWFGTSLLVVVCGAALWKGRTEERITATALLIGGAVTYLLRDPHWSGTQRIGFIVDVAFLGLMIAISLRTAKYWPLCLTAFQLLGVVTHTARMMDPTLGAWAYATAGVIFTQLVLVALAVGTWNTWRHGAHPAAIDDPSTDPGATRR